MKSYVTKKGNKYWPSKEMKKEAWISNPNIYKEADKNPIKFWEEKAREGIIWEKPWTKAYSVQRACGKTPRDDAISEG